VFQYSMLRSPLTTSGPRVARILTLLIGLAALLSAGLVSHADAKSTQAIELGADNINTLKPNCGKDFSRDCTVEGKVTAFQSLSAKYAGRNFVVPFNGKLVTWSISLANPTRVDIDQNDDGKPDYQAQLPAFNNYFGAPAQAGIAILRQVEKKKKNGPRFKLVRKSPVEILNPYFGTKVTFALEKPINVYEGNVVALTIPTWAPALWKPKACNRTIYGDLNPDACARATETYTWRGSRVPQDDPATCNLGDAEGKPTEQLEKTAPQTRIDSTRRYSCYYGGNVLLYSALIVGR
jgi:hypothetical protein